jgi:hypothetical protein
LLVLVALLLVLVPTGVTARPAELQGSLALAPSGTPQELARPLGAARAQEGGGVESLSASFVTFNPDPQLGGDACFTPGASQTFCFDARSYTDDWEWVDSLWIEFPANWIVTAVYVQGTPSCTDGGTWGPFSWSFETRSHEVKIDHERRHAQYQDACLATYCFDVMAGTGSPTALESWYWDGDGSGLVPHHPCSDNQYTPPSMVGEPCDQWAYPQAEIPACPLDPGLYLVPPAQAASGCNGVEQEHRLTLLNNTGATNIFDLSYSVPTGNGTLAGPATLILGNGEAADFVVTLTPDLCTVEGETVTGQVDAAGNGYVDSATIDKTIGAPPGWQAIPGSAPSWHGAGSPRDGCTALNAAGEWVTYELGDMASFFGFWGYDHESNTWYQPGAANTPADRSAADWAYDPDTNLCYVTGGADPGSGATYDDAYVFDPLANAFTQLGSLTTARRFHNSWVGTLDAVKYLCIAGGLDGVSLPTQSTQCYDLAQPAPGTWSEENTQLAALPTDPWGAADGVLHTPTGDQFWYVGGLINYFSTVTDEARYWDDADNAWHLAGNTGVPRYHVEGEFFNGEFYQLGGQSGNFVPTPTVVKGTFDGAAWTWTPVPDMNNARMDNVVGVTGDSLWSVDGYGGNVAAYVERLAVCPLCILEPDIEVNLPEGPLDTALCPDSTDAISFEICNLGTVPLTWDVSEQAGRRTPSQPRVPAMPAGTRPSSSLTGRAAGLSTAFSPDNRPVPGYGGIGIGFDVPWLSEAPSSGTLQVSECVSVVVTFDAAGLAPGPYSAELLIQSDDPDEPIVSLPAGLTVREPANGADFGWSPPDPEIGELVTFIGWVAGGEPPLSYNWQFGDGSTGSGQTVTHSYGAAGDYEVILTVGNACGQSVVQRTVSVGMPCVPPSGAAFTFQPASPVVGGIVTFEGTVGGGTGPFIYQWDWGDGSPPGTGETVTHTYGAAGSYAVALAVTNACGLDTDTQIVTVVEGTEVFFVYLPIVARAYSARGSAAASSFPARWDQAR